MTPELKLNLAAGARPLDGFHNLDKADGWLFEDRLPYPDGSVDAVTESHGLMYVLVEDWPHVFAECARVLRPGGVLRITEDWTDNPGSQRFGGRRPMRSAYVCPCPATPALVTSHMAGAGLVRARQVEPESTRWHDKSLIQQWHGSPPHVFHAEGTKPLLEEV